MEGRAVVASYGVLGCGEAQGTAAVWRPRRRWRVATSVFRACAALKAPPSSSG